MNKSLVRELPSNTVFPVQFIERQSANECVYATQGMDGALLKSNIQVTELDQETEATQLTQRSADYDGVKTIAVKGELWTICTEYRNRDKQILLHRHDGMGENTVYQITEMGKFDNPDMITDGNKMYLAWEDYSQGNCRIAGTTWETEGSTDERPHVAILTGASERAYKPVFASDGNMLYLFYESFFQRRYHIMLRCLQDDDLEFGFPVEIGFDTCNDTDVSVCAHHGKILAVWENSSPLYAGYVFTKARGDVTMPSFGHGWRVHSRLGMRRISYQEDHLAIESLESDDPWNASLGAMEAESSGMPKLLVGNDDQIMIAYVNCERKRWSVRVKHLQNNNWEANESVNASYSNRVRPSIAVCGNRLRLAGSLSADGSGNKGIVEHVLPERQERLANRFSTVKRIRYSRVSAAPQAETEYRHVISDRDTKLELFWGDLHMHSNISVCSRGQRFHCTEVEDKYRFSSDLGRLDFAMITDHDVMSDVEWIETIKAAHFANRDHEFVAFVGIEWSACFVEGQPDYGHYNVLYRDQGPLMRVRDPNYSSIRKVWDHLTVNEALTIPHHPGCDTLSVDWAHYCPDFEPLVEIYQVRGSYESDDCEMFPEQYGRYVVRGNSVRTALDKGYRLGFTSGGEHEGVGLTGVYAEELTRDSVFEALQKRRVYGTTSAKISLEFRIDGQLMGSELTKGREDTQFKCEVVVKGTGPIEYVELVQSEKTTSLYRAKDRAECSVELAVDCPIENTHEYYYIRLKQRDLNMAWSSPIWIDVE